MNVSDIITRVQRSFGDESAVQVTEDDIIRWINDAQRAIVLNNPEVLPTIATVDITKGVHEYAFPADLLLLTSIRAKMPDMQSYQFLPYLNIQEFDRIINGWDGSAFGESGRAFSYTIYNRSIFLFPTPDKDSTDGLKILYSLRPTEITGTQDALSLAEEYHNAIVTYCMAQANTMDEDYEAAAIHEAKFAGDTRTASFQQHYGARETYPVITVLPDDAW